METLTISSFPYYSFADKEMAYRLGSAFYGIYFIISFPLFQRIDEHLVPGTKTKMDVYTIHRVVMEVMATGMMVLLLLDFCRIYCDIPLTISGKAYYIFKP